MPRHPPCALYSLTNSFESGSDWLAKLRWMFTFISCFVNLYEIICEAKDMSKSKAFTNNRSRTSVCLNLFSSVYSVILMGFLMIINHSVCFLVWYVTYQYISHLGCLNFFSLFKIFNMQFSKNNPNNLCYSSFWLFDQSSGNGNDYILLSNR